MVFIREDYKGRSNQNVMTYSLRDKSLIFHASAYAIGMAWDGEKATASPKSQEEVVVFPLEFIFRILKWFWGNLRKDGGAQACAGYCSCNIYCMADEKHLDAIALAGVWRQRDLYPYPMKLLRKRLPPTYPQGNPKKLQRRQPPTYPQAKPHRTHGCPTPRRIRIRQSQ